MVHGVHQTKWRPASRCCMRSDHRHDRHDAGSAGDELDRLTLLLVAIGKMQHDAADSVHNVYDEPDGRDRTVVRPVVNPTATPGSAGVITGQMKQCPQALCDLSLLSDRFCSAWELPLRPNEVARVAVRNPLQVVLVLPLSHPERSSGDHLGYQLARPKARRIDVVDRVIRNPLLFFARVKDG
jgi:hypothetical protein